MTGGVVNVVRLGARSPAELADEILANARTLGFVYISDTGLEDDARTVFASARQFLGDAGMDEKELVRRNETNFGYVAVGGEVLDPASTTKGDPKEVFNIGPIVDGYEPQKLPNALARRREVLERFQHRCHVVSNIILDALAIALKLPERFFSRQHLEGASDLSIIRMLRYPKHPNPSGKPAVLAGAHTDYGSLTLLFQEPGGPPALQLLPPGQSEWKTVPVVPNAVLVNIADALEFWTGGILRSTAHRVIATPEGVATDRYSVAFFYQPKGDAALENVCGADADATRLEEIRAKGGIDAHATVSAGAYLEHRLNASFEIKVKLGHAQAA